MRGMKFTVMLLMICSCYWVNAQLHSQFDTLTYNDRMSGSIDSIDISAADYGTTFDGGVSLISPIGLSADFLFENYTSPTFQSKVSWKNMQVSSLPHLGFSYSFGGQGSQFLNADYQQAFSDSLNLNLIYNRRSGNGSVRNSIFSRNNVQGQLQKLGKFYSFKLKGNYFSANTNHSGGLLKIDSNIEALGLEFIGVSKGNAFSVNKIGDIEFENFFDALKENNNIAVGLYTKHSYSIHNRVFTEESDTLNQLYPELNIDTLSTRDQFNIASVSNGAGLFFFTEKLYGDIALNHRYYDYQNLGTHNYINEFNLTSQVSAKFKRFEVVNDLHVNLVGAFNEFSENLKVNGDFGKINFQSMLNLENRASFVTQRNYFGNAAMYSNSSEALQSFTRIKANLSYEFNESIDVTFFGGYNNISSRYSYDFSQGNWRYDKVPVTFSSIGLKSKLNFGIFNIHPRITYSIDDSNYLPDFQGSARVFVKGRLFKAKKLEAVFGFDINYLSSYNLKLYVPYMDTYDWIASTYLSNEGFNTSAFISLGISEFRFFFRYENFSYLWSDKQSEVITNYTIPEARMRIGVTWDFFN